MPQAIKTPPGELGIPDCEATSLYKADPKRYKPRNRIYTSQLELEAALSKLSSLQLQFNSDSEHTYGQQLIDWEQIEPTHAKSSALPKERLERKRQQLENLVNAVVSGSTGRPHCGLLQRHRAFGHTAGPQAAKLYHYCDGKQSFLPASSSEKIKRIGFDQLRFLPMQHRLLCRRIQDRGLFARVWNGDRYRFAAVPESKGTFCLLSLLLRFSAAHASHFVPIEQSVPKGVRHKGLLVHCPLGRSGTRDGDNQLQARNHASRTPLHVRGGHRSPAAGGGGGLPGHSHTLKARTVYAKESPASRTFC